MSDEQAQAMNHFYVSLMESVTMLRHRYERNHPGVPFIEHAISLTWDEPGHVHCEAVVPTEQNEESR